VGSALLTRGQHPSQTLSAQVSPKREDVSQVRSLLGSVPTLSVERFAERMSVIRVTVLLCLELPRVT